MNHTIAIICGGPGPERGISLNSARSLFSHLDTSRFVAKSFYVDQQQRFYALSNAQLLSNTPSDFDFKLQRISTALSQAELRQALSACDMVFSCIHGVFGEDGVFHAWLEKHNIPFVGSSSAVCTKAYPKIEAQTLLKQNGFATLPFLALTASDANDSTHTLSTFWRNHCNQHAIAKPSHGGSSIGVKKVDNIHDCLAHCQALAEQGHDVIVQPYRPGSELTIIVIETQNGPVALMPTESQSLDASSTPILDFRSKYLPTNQCQHFTPPRLSSQNIQAVRQQAQALFCALRMHDVARFDGWWCPTQGFICNDINVLSGMEENSFLFKQASLAGLDHTQAINCILQNAYARHGLSFPSPSAQTQHKQPIAVLFGGASAERQVSLMSGRNVWLQLRKSKRYAPIPYFLDHDQQVWQLPYHMHFHHTCEEVQADIQRFNHDHLAYLDLAQRIGQALTADYRFTTPANTLQPQNLTDWCASIASSTQRVFIALHGGIGEDGTLQALFDQYAISHQGSDAMASKRCMDKKVTQDQLAACAIPNVCIGRQIPLSIEQMRSHHQNQSWQRIWDECCKTLERSTLLIKPQADGCSAGVAALQSPIDLAMYATYTLQKKPRIPADTLSLHASPIELPPSCKHFLIEAYVETDALEVKNHQLHHITRSGWIELTAVVTEHQSNYHCMQPSITVRQSNILSVEEKFQGGTGINITPPPPSLVTANERVALQLGLERVAQALGVRDYARIDVFYHPKSGNIRVIEVNSLPALTPSTVLFQQALMESPAQYPLDFLEARVEYMLERQQETANN